MVDADTRLRAAFMLLLDITIVNVALPEIQSDLGASLSSLQWVADAYALTLAAFLLAAGSIGDRVGRRRVFSVGFGIFTVASFLCGIAGDPTLLNSARGLQGIGGGAMFATTLALIAQEFQGRERATAIGAWGATVGGAIAIGPLVGGLLPTALAGSGSSSSTSRSGSSPSCSASGMVKAADGDDQERRRVGAQEKQEGEALIGHPPAITAIRRIPRRR